MSETPRKIPTETREQVAENKAKKFLNEKPRFGLRIKAEIAERKNAPTEAKARMFYENVLYLLGKHFEGSLFLELKKQAENKDSSKTPEGIAMNLQRRWLRRLKMSDKNNDGWLDESEITGDAFPGIKNVIRLRAITEQLKELKKDEPDNLEKKKGLLEQYLETLAGDPNLGFDEHGCTRFVEDLRGMLLEMAGSEQMTVAEFGAWLKTLEDDPNSPAAKMLKKATATGADKDFRKLLEKEDNQIISLHKKEIMLGHDRARAAAYNPYGFDERTYGSLFSALLFAGEKVLYGVILVNFALCGFNPMKLIKSPVLWATAGGLFLTAKHYNPDIFSGPSEMERAVKNDFKEIVGRLPKESPVRDWLDNDTVRINDAVRKLISSREDKARAITSAELAGCFPGKEEVFSDLEEIKTDHPPGQAENLFEVLSTCVRLGIQPKKALEKND